MGFQFHHFLQLSWLLHQLNRSSKISTSMTISSPPRLISATISPSFGGWGYNVYMLILGRVLLGVVSLGDAPLVIAHGGFSGLFPDSSSFAYRLALQTGLPNTILWCDVQLTSDGFGVCLPNLLLNNGSDIANIFANKNRTYLVNGISTTGYFSVDFTLKELLNVSVMTIQDVVKQLTPPGLWLNIQALVVGVIMSTCSFLVVF